MTPPDTDVVIIGAGISGISMAAHMGMLSPDLDYLILDRREQIGGTWDLFRYPGIRSDSDMHTLGFGFEPWRHEDTIADAPAILDYLNRVADERGIRERMRFGQEVTNAAWDGASARWTITARGSDGETTIYTARWLYFASGYYDYDNPHDAAIPGIADFAGTVVHPQFWPQDLDYTGKDVVVIGSGATAVTLVPAMADQANSVTMLQRTPSWMGAMPRRDAFGMIMQKWLPERLAYRVTRWKNIALRDYIFRLSRRNPGRIADRLRTMTREALGDNYDPVHFEPPYNPWEQRLCLVPDGDLFAAINAGKARIVTDRIEGFDAGGVRLQSGERLPADIVVTATGLRLALAGKVEVSLDGKPLDWTQHYFYRGTMFSDVPNLSFVFGYLNASWTLRADSNARYACEVLNHMARVGADVAVPELAAQDEPDAVEPWDYTSGYLERARPLMPKVGAERPWTLAHDYLADRRDFRHRPVADSVLRFHRVAPHADAAA
ncbi:SidA/IucD/PvdA family monooxygenase [Erythrobacter arachoides]|uniref:SidA/IucD/PvdA family monooxygenase n=1 Tax=Aurantiacibacter arachoides TaxID=1850444 RepID=A0A845A3A2_9SPHN|nr:NAD(P)/FAD-dependent oxidoreductase [Aurantiacibacter arachoides]MXO94184.1 SidA/IucD/PvdA family monooxygenase [Aurantiacibacter arachoides]GGD65445.1 monooxygenase [Aurantiacibacter arachoides]